MDIMEAIRTRRSIRAYQERTVEKEKSVQIIEAGRLAPFSTQCAILSSILHKFGGPIRFL